MAVLLGIATLSSIAAGVLATTAAACSTSSHCYGQAAFVPDGTYTGGLAYINSSRLNVNGSTSTFATNELWVCDQNVNCYTWTESGMRHGARFSEDVPGTNLAWFWAEQPTGGTGCANYAEHYGGMPGVALNVTYHAKISYNNHFKYGVYRDGSFLANTSACHDPSPYVMAAGSETTDDSAHVSGSASGLQKRGADGTTWSYNWGGSFLVNDAPYSTSWTIQYSSLSYTAN